MCKKNSDETVTQKKNMMKPSAEKLLLSDDENHSCGSFYVLVQH